MTVYELRILAAIIARACASLPSRESEELVRETWLFLQDKRRDLTLALWQAMINTAGIPPGYSPRPGSPTGPGQPARPGDLTLHTADGPAVLRAHKSVPHASPPYVIVSYHAPDFGERFAAYEKRATGWIMADTMLNRAEAATWLPASGEARGEPVPEVAAWLGSLPDIEIEHDQAEPQSPPTAAVTFHPGAGSEAPPCLEISGVLVFTYIDPDSGVLVVSLDLDAATPDILSSAGTVPVQITVQGTTVFDSSAT